MAETVTAKVEAALTVTEILGAETESAAPARRTVVHNQFNVAETLTSATAVPVTKVAADHLALTAGALTMDLTALKGTGDAARTLLGLKVQEMLIVAAATNVGALTFVKGASNGYGLLGASFNLAIPPGGHALVGLKDQAPDVASGAKTIDVSGTGTDSFDYIAVAG